MKHIIPIAFRGSTTPAACAATPPYSRRGVLFLSRLVRRGVENTWPEIFGHGVLFLS